MNTRNSIHQYFKHLLITGAMATLVACGGGSSSSSSGSGDDDSAIETAVSGKSVVSRGMITQIGSIHLTGNKYETPDGNSYSSDDKSGKVAKYRVGQVVKVRGELKEDGTRVALEVEYEAEIEGKADGGMINGITILLSENTNSSDITGFAGALDDNVRYEASGFWHDDTILEATYIKIDDDGDFEDEIKGYVKNVVPATSFDVRGITFLSTNPPAEKTLVEVHFNPADCLLPADDCTPIKIEIEDEFDDHGKGQEYEIEGPVNLDMADLADCPNGADFLIDMTCIDWDSVPNDGWMDGLTSKDDMVAGLRVEAEGHFNADGLLIAEKIKGRGNRVRVTSTASDIDGGSGTFKLFFGDIQVTTMDGLTEYDLDELIPATPRTSVGDIVPGEGLEVRGIRIGTTPTGEALMLALRIKSEDPLDPDRHEIRAEVDEDGADPDTKLVKVMGIYALLDSDTELKIEDVQIAPGDGFTSEADIEAFLDMIDDDDIVNSSNGPRDIVDVEIDTTNGGDGSELDPYSAEEVEIEQEDD